MSLKSQLRTHGLKFLPEDLSSGYLRPEKIYQLQPGLSLQTLDVKASTLP